MAGTSSTNRFEVYIDNGTDKLEIDLNNGAWVIDFISNAVFRDVSAWYHLVIAVDTTQTGTNQVKAYVNSVAQTWSTSTSAAANTNTPVNSVAQHSIGYNHVTGVSLFDGYLAEYNFIDGYPTVGGTTYNATTWAALNVSSLFGATDATTGVWKPIAYTGTYGTNGFYLKFNNTSAIGTDSSPNGNTWAATNIQVSNSALTTYDSMTDTPTPYDNGANGAGNYATLNTAYYGSGTYLNGNLEYNGPTAWGTIPSTIQLPPSTKWYAEATVKGAANGNGSGNIYAGFGITPTSFSPSTVYPTFLSSGFWVGDNGWIYNFSSTGTNIGAAFTTNDVIGLAIDTGANSYTVYKNGTSVGTGTLGMTSGTPVNFSYCSYNNQYGQMALNFGQRPFTYTPPSGFKALNTYNLPTPTIAAGNKYFDATLYTGNGTSQSITNSGSFQPDLVWVKIRSTTASHCLYDAIRGVRAGLFSNLTNAETTEAAGVSLTAFNSNGFSLGTDNAVTGSTNLNAATYVGWQWNAGGSTVTGYQPSGATIVSSVRANPTAGFSVVTWTGTGATGATVGHGLSILPNFVIIKKRNVSEFWYVAHSGSGQGINYAYHFLLNTTGALVGSNDPYYLSSQISTTSNVLVLADGTANNGGNQSGTTYVAYCWSAVAGYSAFGSYTGNGTAGDGPFCYTGFRPRYLLIKRTDSTSDWTILDSARDTYNVEQNVLWTDLTSAEAAAAQCDFLSNGFKIRAGAGGANNISGGTYVYACFSENPFKYSLAR